MRKVKGAELTERQRYWLEQVEACAAAGKTIAEYVHIPPQCEHSFRFNVNTYSGRT
jgi:hypothetical protein